MKETQAKPIATVQIERYGMDGLINDHNSNRRFEMQDVSELGELILAGQELLKPRPDIDHYGSLTQDILNIHRSSEIWLARLLVTSNWLALGNMAIEEALVSAGHRQKQEAAGRVCAALSKEEPKNFFKRSKIKAELLYAHSFLSVTSFRSSKTVVNTVPNL